MLRNWDNQSVLGSMWVLNEVLSLNAQESVPVIVRAVDVSFLNEVLSLNAQELDSLYHRLDFAHCPQ